MCLRSVGTAAVNAVEVDYIEAQRFILANTAR
jgi:hypothetical protein